MSEIQIVPASDFGQKRIGILCLPGLETFIKPIVAHLEENYAVRTCYSKSLPELESVIDWSNLVVLEWGNQLAIEISNKVSQLKDKKVILRIHSYEVLSGFLSQIRWEVIDTTIFVAKHIADIAIKQIPNLPKMTNIEIIPNGV